ncbi:cryptochrome-2-like [Carassius carassius]|uniref:cryptochrome-2-like n=1 Tax=Carassius carassius TaxID=217509 RepID=UPI00286969B6|nr:cryptochrome-2-like [Carassius carassius]XP_059400438.1 cryptochrome-2-like [Carassius carassius]
MPLSLEGVSTSFSEYHEEEFGIPTLEDLGLDTSSLGPDLFLGGEQEALHRLDEHMQRTVWVCKLKKTQTFLNSMSPSTPVLSPYIRFGCSSACTFWWCSDQHIFSSLKLAAWFLD